MIFTKHIGSLDIETVPDVELARQIEPKLAEVSDSEVRDWIANNRAYKGFPNTMFHKVVAASFAHTIQGSLIVENIIDDEDRIISVINDILGWTSNSEFQVSTWNGASFDFPVLAYRAMKYGVSLESYWNDEGNNRWNTYYNRYQHGHLDLMDIFQNYGMASRAKLNDIAVLTGLPGKIGIGGVNIDEAWQKGDTQSIADYCEVDAMITHLLHIRFWQTAGLPRRKLYNFLDMVDEFFDKTENPLITEFESQWSTDCWRK